MGWLATQRIKHGYGRDEDACGYLHQETGVLSPGAGVAGKGAEPAVGAEPEGVPEGAPLDASVSAAGPAGAGAAGASGAADAAGDPGAASMGGGGDGAGAAADEDGASVQNEPGVGAAKRKRRTRGGRRWRRAGARAGEDPDADAVASE